ncbi:MAG: cytochrome c3 family protein [Actinobacteria bacterium]|nr:cytochrome c3 family protein [Actinomycetota bacterium]
MSVRLSGRATAARRCRRVAALLLVLLPVLTLALVLGMAGTALALDVEGCLICHGDPNFTNPTPAAGEPTSLYVNSKAFESSVHGGNKCSSCHKGFLLTIPQHTEQTGKDFRQVAIEACEGCHQKEFMQYQTSSHAKLYYQDQAGPICISCHGSHEIRKVSLGKETADFKMSMARDSCGRCHKDKFEKAKHEFHFKALSLGYARAATCFDCHGFHDNLALKAGTQETLTQCRQCHPGATLGFTYFQMHLDEGFQNAWWGVRVVYLFFSVLLVVVLVVGIAYTTVHFQKETRTVLGVIGRGMGRLFGFIRALEDESVRDKISDDVDGGSSEGRGADTTKAPGDASTPEKKGEE